MDSHGADALVWAEAYAHVSGRRFGIVGAQPHVLHVLRFMGLDAAPAPSHDRA